MSVATAPGEGSVEARVLELIKKEMEGKGTGEITLETAFVEDLGLDSLDTVELMMLLEDKFSVHIPDEDAVKIKTVGDAVKYIVAHQPK
jgi:acyl carrier protein